MAPASAGSRRGRGRIARRGRLATAALLGALAPASMATSADASAALPATWPFTGVELGLRDPEHGAAALRARGSYGIRYHYLSGGVNTGQGWRTWREGDGSFVPAYLADSRTYGFATVFSYYQLYQSAPALGHGDEEHAVLANLSDPATMNAYYEDLEAFFRRAAPSTDATIVLQVEPDAWGYLQRAGRMPAAAVASTGRSELAGLPNNAAGFAQAIVRLRDLYAPRVLLGYHLSPWGSGIDPALSAEMSNERIDAAVAESVAFYKSIGADFDLTFAEFTNRDSGYVQQVDGFGDEATWIDQDFAWHARFIHGFASATAKPVILWQIPFGNTVMRALDNTRFHYQDNKVQRLLGDASGVDMQRYVDAGAIAFLFGTAIPGTTCACDAAGDGITNPAPINGNDAQSLSADDDGGYFHATAAEWYAERQPRLSDPKIRARAQVGRVTPGRQARIRLRIRSSETLRARLTLSIERRGKEFDRIVRTGRLRDGRRKLSIGWRVPRRAPSGRASLALVVAQRADSRTIAADPRVAVFRISSRP